MRRETLCLIVALASGCAAPQTAGAESTPKPPPGCDLHALAATHTAPPYPVMSQRIGEEGISALAVTIAADGTPSDVALLKSSGSPRLDLAAMEYVKARWRWQPLDAACGASVKSAVNLNWNLRANNNPADVVTEMVMDRADFPPGALAKAEQGVVGLLVTITPEGQIQPRLFQSSGFADLDQRALEIVRSRWKFQPAEIGERNVTSIVQLAIRWNLPFPLSAR